MLSLNMRESGHVYWPLGLYIGFCRLKNDCYKVCGTVFNAVIPSKIKFRTCITLVSYRMRMPMKKKLQRKKEMRRKKVGKLLTSKLHTLNLPAFYS